MEKILFIVPPYVSYDNFVNPSFFEATMQKNNKIYKNLVVDMPLGVLSLSAYLKRHTKVDIKVIDFNVIINKLENFNFNSFKELYSEILSGEEYLDFAPTVIGISSLFMPSYFNTLDIAKVGRNIFPKSVITAGGSMATTMYKEIFDAGDYFDALCYGEGELPFLGLLKAINKQEYLKNSSSWVTKEKIDNKELLKHDFIDDLDEIPFYDYDLLDVADYRLNDMLGNYPLAKKSSQSMPVITTRGCPYFCNFCSSHAVHGRKVRFHSLDHLRNDFKRLIEKYGIVAIKFMDDHFMANKKRAYELISIMKELGLTAYFPSSLTLFSLDKPMLTALNDIGVDNLVLSVESGSQRVLRELMHKPLNLKIIKQVTNDCYELGIKSDINILVGLPGETKQDLEDTRSFLKTIKATWFRINVATPLVGSEMFDTAVENNYLKGDYMESNYKTSVIETEDFTAEEIGEFAYSLNLELNFVENSDLRVGNYEDALIGFIKTLKLKNDHAFASYFAALCHKKMNSEDQYQIYKLKYQEILNESVLWQGYAKRFNLPKEPSEFTPGTNMMENEQLAVQSGKFGNNTRFPLDLHLQ
ncbi:MAG: radical SAM protein [Bacteroidota bacterium]|nr:radical SAM protein [Bacteroidota bacterium]